MSQNHATPTPEQLDALKQAAAFAYGYALAMYGATQQAHYYDQILSLRRDLQTFGILTVGGWTAADKYFESQMSGATKAAQELEAKNI